MNPCKRIAILSDVHGNLPALHAVLDDIRENEIDELIVAGDMVGRGPQGDEVVSELRRVTDSFIGGNHEEYLLNFHDRRVPEEWLTAPEWEASRWMAAQLSHDSIHFLRTLPFSTSSRRVPNLRIVHGSPFSNREGIGPWTPTDRLKEHLEAIEEDYLVCAHTHRPFEVKTPLGSIVNIGAVGLPFNGDQHAQYGWFEYDGEEIRFIPRRIAYNVEETLQAYLHTGFLSAGGVVAELLAIEVRDARSVLVPFENWLKETQRPLGWERFVEFLQIKEIEAVDWSRYKKS